jgi:hypothetical protein
MNSWVIADSGLFIATVLPEKLTAVATRKIQEWIDGGMEFWTTDERLYNTAHSSFSYIRWLGTSTP